MIENELTALRRVNPVAERDVAALVAAHRSAFVDAIAETSTQTRPPDSVAVAEETATVRPSRFNLLVAAAAALVILVFPTLLLASAMRNDNDRQILNEPPTEEPAIWVEPNRPDEDPDSESELFVPVPSSSTDTSADSTTASTTAPTTSSSLPPTTSIAPSAGAAGAPPVPPAASTSTSSSPASTNTATDPAPPPTPGVSPDTTPPSGDPSSRTTPPTEASAGTTTTTVSPPTTTEPAPSGDASQPFDPERDLLVVTLDFAMRDDGHAAVATREIATSRELDVLIVAGTAATDSGASVQEYDVVMSAAWGSNWLDATADRAGAVAEAADRWLATIDRGGVVRVGEGGVSDFTADVVRELQRRRPALDTTATIQVVHHSGRNEDETRSGDLDLVRSDTSYQRIDDGNSANGTADLNGASNAFESAALAGAHAGAWTVAFDYRPAASLDFSDTVTALHILGVGLDEVADPDGFATAFIP